MHKHEIECDGPNCAVKLDVDDDELETWYDLTTIAVTPQQSAVERMMGVEAEVRRPNNMMRGTFHSDVCLLDYVTAAVERISKGEQPLLPAKVEGRFPQQPPVEVPAENTHGYA